MSQHTTEVHAEHSEEHESMTKKKIWNVFFILLAITCVEFFIALYLVPHQVLPVQLVNPAYIILTLLKAYFIVAFFMHLKFERMALIVSIIVPIIFIVGLILVLTNESHHWIGLRGPGL
jgi:cytochrome c oxidase subunit IV